MQIKILDQDKALAYIRRFNDIRFAGQVLFVVIILLVSWSGIKSIQTNYGLQKQISALDQQNNVQRLENNNISKPGGTFSSTARTDPLNRLTKLIAYANIYL
jgi:hypothetical protein